MKFALAGLGSYPSYYKYMADMNRRGPDVLGGVPQPASLTPLSVRNQLGENALLVDARQERLFNEGHVPGSFAVPFGDTFATWLGWLLPLRPAIDPLAAGSSASRRHGAPAYQFALATIESMGSWPEGFEAWESAHLPTESAKGLDLETLKDLSDQEHAPMILDVRQRSEYHAGHIKGALNIELGSCKSTWTGFPERSP